MKYAPFSFWMDIINYLKEVLQKPKSGRTVPIDRSPPEQIPHPHDKVDEELFSVKIPAKNRVYYFDVKRSYEGAKYLCITEINKEDDENRINPKIVIYPEHIQEVKKALDISFNYMFGKISYKAQVEKSRMKYPQAYSKWTEDEENRLKNEYLQGKSVKELSQIFKRSSGGIRKRLKKLGLINY